MPPSLNNFSVCVPFYGSAFECHWPALGGDGWNYWSERNKAVTFIALSDLLRHQGNKQKAKLIVPDHIRPVTPPPDPTGTTALFCFQHALLPFSAAPDILTKKQTAQGWPGAPDVAIRFVGWPIKWFPIEGFRLGGQRSGGLMKPTWRACGTSKHCPNPTNVCSNCPNPTNICLNCPIPTNVCPNYPKPYYARHDARCVSGANICWSW